MKKTYLTALGAVFVLFLYGKFASFALAPFKGMITSAVEHLHPMAVHFPVALFITALILEVLSFIFKRDSLHQSAVSIYVFASFITPLVVVTGFWEEKSLNIHHPLLEEHERFAFWTMWVSLMSLPVLWLVKKEFTRYFKIIFLTVLISAAVLVSMTGDKGGHMVYEYGVGVEE